MRCYQCDGRLGLGVVKYLQKFFCGKTCMTLFREERQRKGRVLARFFKFPPW